MTGNMDILENMRKMLEAGEISKEDIVRAFPKLNESEDERIRKWLIDYFDKVNDEVVKEDRLKIIAYLEKQKDVSKAIEAVERIDKYIDAHAANAQDMDDSNPDKKYYQGCDDALGKIAGILQDVYSDEKQKEQKPESCDCSRDEESYTNGIHHVLMNPEAYGLIKQKPAEQLGGTFTSYDMAKTFTDGQNYVIAHPEKFGLCKPAEWKEKDEGMLNCIIATLCEESHGGREANGKMVTWLETRLKLLRPQLIQDKFDSAMHVADKFEEGYKAGVYDTKAKSWKPSQQQMANLINVRDHVAQASGYWGESLSSLIDDLKKL